MPCHYRPNAVPKACLGGSRTGGTPLARLFHANLHTHAANAAAKSSAEVSGGNADDPTAEAHLAIQPRPAEVAGIPAAGVADVDATRVVADPDKPVSLTKPAGTIHQQRALVEPRLQFRNRTQWPQLSVARARLTCVKTACR